MLKKFVPSGKQSAAETRAGREKVDWQTLESEGQAAGDAPLVLGKHENRTVAQ